MEKFKKITLEDKSILKNYVNGSKYMACDYSVANLILWSGIYNTEYTIVDDFLFIKFQSNEITCFAFPMGNGDLKSAFEWMENYCEENNIEFRLNIVEPDMYAKIEEIFPDKYDIVYVRDNADYIYNMEDLKNLSGKKYHGKKNHINKFLKSYHDWSYEVITDDNTEECIEMVKDWCVQSGCCNDKDKANEVCILIKGLKHRKELELTGGLIRVAGRVIAMTLGEPINDETFIIHFEKAFTDFEGAFPMINQQFIIHELADYTYINREEDLGVEGLRKSKESYRPVFMIEKGYLVNK